MRLACTNPTAGLIAALIAGPVLIACTPPARNAVETGPDRGAVAAAAPAAADPSWMAADGAGETALVYGVLGGETQMVLSCSMAAKTFKVAANGLSGGSLAAGERASLSIGTASFEGEVRSGSPAGEASIELSLPLTAAIVGALTTPGPVRVTFRGQTRTAPADPQMSGLAQTCSLWI